MIFDLICAALHIIAEMIPISSSGHLALCTQLSTLCYELLHLPTVAIIGCSYAPRLYSVLQRFSKCWKTVLHCIFFVVLSGAITAFFYFSNVHFPATWWRPEYGMIITALLLAITYWLPIEAPFTAVRWYHIILLSIVQGCALVPGISRLGSTYAVARMLGIRPLKAFDCSWMIVYALQCAAALNSLMHITDNVISLWATITFTSATIISWYVFKWSRYMAIQNRYWLFSWYLVAVVVILNIVRIVHTRI